MVIVSVIRVYFTKRERHGKVNLNTWVFLVGDHLAIGHEHIFFWPTVQKQLVFK